MKKKVDEEANEEKQKKCGVTRTDELLFRDFQALLGMGNFCFPKDPKR